MTKTAAILTSSANTKAVVKSKRGRKGLHCRNLSNEQRESLLQSLLKRRDDVNDERNRNGKSSTFSKEALEEVAQAFGVSTKTCTRIWQRFLETADDSGSGGDVSHRKNKSGRHKKISAQELVTKIRGLPLETRSSVRGLARALGMPHTTIHRRLRSGEIQLESPLCKTPPETKTSQSKESTENTNEALGNQKTNKTTKVSNTKAKSSAANKKVAV